MALVCPGAATKCYLRSSVLEVFVAQTALPPLLQRRKLTVALRGSSGLRTATRLCCPARSSGTSMLACTIREAANRDAKA